MKYNININQKELAKTGLDIKDSAILDYLIVYANSKNKKIEKKRIKNEEGVWTWLNYKTIASDMPLLRIKSASAMSKRISKITEEGFIETYHKDNQKLYFQLTDKIDNLFIDKIGAIRKNEQSHSFSRTNNNTNDNITNQIPLSAEAEEVFNLETELDTLRASKRKDFKIIADYIALKKFKFENKKQYLALFKRCLKPASQLVGYNQQQILKIIGHCKSYDEWTLETVVKRSADVINK